MITRWKNDSLLLLATPIAGALLQFSILSWSALAGDAHSGARVLAGAAFIAAFLLPVVSIPAFVNSYRRLKAKRERGISLAACIANALYFGVLILGALALAGPFLSHANR
jgi:hypothetical protein